MTTNEIIYISADEFTYAHIRLLLLSSLDEVNNCHPTIGVICDSVPPIPL